MGKYRIGQKVKLKHAPSGKPSSGNGNISLGGYYYIQSDYITGCEKGYNITNSSNMGAGWVFEHEIVGSETKEEITNQIEELQSEIDCLKSKLNWMNEVGVDEYDDDEFKVYETLKTLQNDSLDIKSKTKLIASLIKQNN